MSEEVRKSKIEESYRIIYREYSTRTYEVRAKDEDEVDSCCPDELEVLYDESEYDDSERDEVTRFLSEPENKERLALHKLWKAGDPEGEQYYVRDAEIERYHDVSITAEHHGAVFEDCTFSNVPFEGVDFSKIEFIGCTFSEHSNLKDCKGLEEKEMAKPGDLWFYKEQHWNDEEKKYVNRLVPVIIKKWNVLRYGMQCLKVDFEGVMDGKTTFGCYGSLQKDAIL